MSKLFFEITVESKDSDNPMKLTPYLIEGLDRAIKQGDNRFFFRTDEGYGDILEPSLDGDYMINVKWLNFDGVEMNELREIGVRGLLIMFFRKVKFTISHLAVSFIDGGIEMFFRKPKVRK